MTNNGSDPVNVERIREGNAQVATQTIPQGVGSLQGFSHKSDLLLEVFEHCSDLIQIIGIDGRIELVNPAWCQTLGYSEAEAIGRNVFELIAPDCQEHCQLLFRDMLSEVSRRRIECAFLARNGRRIDLQGQLDVALSDGRPVRVRGILRDVSEQRTAQRALQALNDSLETRILESTAALRSSEARLKEAQALGGIGHWELDLTSGTMHWSEEICRLAGFDPSSVTPSYELFLDKVHPEDRAQIVAANQRLLELREPLELNYRLLLKDGEVRHVQARLVTQVDQEGQPIRVIGTSQDVSRLVASQRQLRESEQSFRSLFELSPLGIALIDQEGRCLRSNQAFRRLIEGETNHGAPIELSAEATILLERIRRSTLESEDLSPTSDHLLPRLDGSLVPVRVRAQRLTTTEANHAHPPVWLMLEDRTGQLAREQELRQAANVFRYAQEGIMITKLDSTIIDVNEAFCQITGYERQDVLGATPNLLKSGVHDGAFYSEMWRQLETAGAWSGEVTNRAKDGSHREMLETISAVKGDDGQVSHYVALLTDIRQIKDQQRQLEQLALYDTLTGLPNRILLARELQQAMHRSQNGEHTIAVCYLDLDGFKEINDNLGHAAGDHLLKVLAARMGAVLRPGDLLARLGGDEFVLILRESPGETFEQTTAVLELILETLMQQVHWNGEAMQVTASIGVSRYPHDLRDQGPDQLLRHADNAMYNAKRLGKNRYAFATT